MAYDPDKIFGTTASGGYDPDKIFGSPAPAPEPAYVAQSRGLGMSEDDYAPKVAESEADDSAFGTFKGIAENLGLALNLPLAMIGGAADVVEGSIKDVGTAAAALNPFSDVKIRDSELLTGIGDLLTGDTTPVEIAQAAGETFAQGTGNRIITGSSPEAQAVRGAVADAIPREAVQIVEALPPSGVAIRAANTGFASDLIPVFGKPADEAVEMLQVERQGAGLDPVALATEAVRNRGDRIQANSDTLTGRSTGSAYMTDEHFNMIESANPRMKQLFNEQMDDAQRLRDGAGDATATPYNVIGREFETRANVLGEMGDKYLADMAEARRKITSGEGYHVGGSAVYTSTRRLRKQMETALEELGVKIGDDGKLDFYNSPIYEGQGKLQKAIERFMAGTSTRETGYTAAADFDDLDNLKKYLQRAGYVNSRKNGPGGETNALIQRLSGMVNGTLREISPEYAAANDGLSSVITGLQDLASATKATTANGQPINLMDTGFDRASSRLIAQNARKLTSNYESGITLDEALRSVDEVLVNEAGKGQGSRITPEQLSAVGLVDDGKGGLTQSVNPRQLALFASYLDALYGNGKPTSLRGLIKESDSRHMENLVANSIWGNAVGASAAGYKGFTGWLRTPEQRMRASGKDLAEQMDLRKELEQQVKEALRETLGR